jgi:hypothetical protein
MDCLTPHRRRGSTERNGSGDAGCSSPWRRSPRSSRPHARQRDPEDAALSRCITGRTQPTPTCGHRGPDDDSGARVSLARAMSLPAPLGVRGLGSVADGRCRTPGTTPWSPGAAKRHNRPPASPGDVRGMKRPNFRIHPTASPRGSCAFAAQTLGPSRESRRRRSARMNERRRFLVALGGVVAAPRLAPASKSSGRIASVGCPQPHRRPCVANPITSRSSKGCESSALLRGAIS